MTDANEFFSTYCNFVTKVTSKPSIDIESLKESLENVQNNSIIDVPRLLTSALGMGSEGGEFVEIVKKIILQGKPADEDNIFHMKRELGDIMWYWVTACMALGLDPVEVISENQKKLEARYGKEFSIDQSEIRAKGDL
jgi:NTP pyrophosphatase (non-canonical NTP hydrolase)|tara:strand:+ start:95 stop:508 length:414 start_codon:yes stop_codon:yes gene_type:complete